MVGKEGIKQYGENWVVQLGRGYATWTCKSANEFAQQPSCACNQL